MAITPNPPGTINTPNSPTAESAGAVQAPNDPTAQAAVAINTPNSPTAESAGTINTPNSPTAESAGAIQAPNDPTALGAGVIPRTLVPTLNLDFASGLYAQNGTPKTQDELITFSRGSTGSFLNRQKDANNDWQYFVDSATNDALRFEYDAATGESLGALIEGGSSNLCLRSEEFDHVDWTETNATITANDTKSPDLSTSADKYSSNATTDQVLTVLQTITGLTASTPYTISLYAKRAEVSVLQVLFTTGHVSNDPIVNFDLSTGAIGSQDVDIDSASIVPVGADWYRISATVTTVGTSLGCALSAKKSASAIWGANESWTAGEGLYIWGAQVEQQEAATSYIKTTSAPVARAKDDAVSDMSFPGNQITMAVDALSKRGSVAIAELSKGATGSDRINAYRDNDNIFVFMEAGNVHIVNEDTGVDFVDGVPNKIAIVLNTNSFQAYIDGTIEFTDVSIVPPVGLTRLNIGQRFDNTEPYYGHIKQLKIYDKALTAQEVALL